MKRGIRYLTGTLFFVIVSCAVITVNIYFPEKDVKEAYKQLENELMKPEENMEQKAPEAPQSSGPESFLNFRFVASAYAQEPGMADKIAELVKRMPDVVDAYRQMGERINDTDRLRNSGDVGEGNEGVLVVRNQSISPADKGVVEAENANRRTVMNGMAKAIIRINRLPENDANLKQVLPQAKEQFAAIRRDSAKKGWWIQDPSGNWNKK